jgi:hypothetical protein
MAIPLEATDALKPFVFVSAAQRSSAARFRLLRAPGAWPRP